MVKRKRSSPPPRTIPAKAVVADYVKFYAGNLYYPVEHKGNVIFWIPHRILQRLERDVLSGLLTRWEEGKPCAPLLPSGVKVRDHRAILPKIGSSGEHYDYQGNFLNFHEHLFGTNGTQEDRDDFHMKLRSPNISREHFAALFFHKFLQNEEERADFPADAVDNLQDTSMSYMNQETKWSDIYSWWHKGQITLSKVSKKNHWVRCVYKFRHYQDTPVDEALLVRNTVKHLNERREKATPPARLYSKCRKGAVVQRVFPQVGNKLYNFMWDSEIDMDFKKSLSVFTSP